MKFSLIVATLGRVTELARFLACLDQQTFRDFELIVVDQNPDDRLDPIVGAYVNSYPLHHLRASPGVSRARNLGMGQARGEIVGFPDDDCWYLPGTLERLAKAFEEQPEADGLTGPCIDDSGVILRRGPRTAARLTKYNLFPRTCAVTMFLRRDRIASLGGFDETLGPGSGTPWGSAEDHEYIARALAAGALITYHPDLGVCHADAPHAFDEHEIQKERAYSRGEGRFLKMHDYSRWYLSYRIARALGGAAIGAMRADGAKVRYHLSVVVGKLEGWRESCFEVPALRDAGWVSTVVREAKDDR
ncbi:MAG: glycosyltransferase family A protein [Candidatus Binataceae bacterium]